MSSGGRFAEGETATKVRPPAVAGLFYPADGEALAAEVDRYLGAAPSRSAPAVLAPHAGYAYSGAVAGRALAELESDPEGSGGVVVVIGPSHHFAFRGVATSPAEWFATPLGEIEVDRGICAALESVDGVSASEAFHAPEHSIEVELPFLQRLERNVRIVPLLIGECEPSTVAQVLEHAVERGASRFVVSSDLSHFLAAEAAERCDARTVERIANLADDLDPTEACGARAINGFHRFARRVVWSAEPVDRSHSGETGGEMERVVGYGAVAYRRGSQR